MKAGVQTSFPFLIKSGSGLLTDPDTDSTVVIYKNGIETSIAVTIDKLSVGMYHAKFDVPSTWVQGDVVNAKIEATIEGFKDTALIKVGSVELDALAVEKAMVDPGDTVDLIGAIAEKVTTSTEGSGNTYTVTFEKPGISNAVKGRVATQDFTVKTATGIPIDPPGGITIKEIKNQKGQVLIVKGAYVAVDSYYAGEKVVGRFRINIPTTTFELGDTIDVVVSASTDAGSVTSTKQLKIVAF